MDRTTKWFAALVLTAMLGCDKPPPPPPTVTGDDAAADASTTEPEDRRPKTDEIMSASWRPVQLGNHPLRLQAPPTWESKTIGTAVVLRGPAPNGPPPEGVTEITVNKPPPFPKEMAKSFEAEQRRAATRPAAAATTAPASATEINAVTAREIGPNRVLDLRRLQPAVGNLPPMVDWRLVVFVPAGADTVNTYQLNFIGLTLDQYQKDKELLEKIVNSLEVDALSPLVPSTPKVDPFK